MEKIYETILDSLIYFGPQTIDEILQKLEYGEIRLSNTATSLVLRKLVDDKKIVYSKTTKTFRKA